MCLTVVVKQRLAKKVFLSFLSLPLVLGTLTSAPAVAEEPLPTESVSATPSPIPSDSIAPTVAPEEGSTPSAEPTSAPSLSPEPSSSPSPTLSPEPTALPTVQDDFRLIVTFNATENKAEQAATLSNLDNADLVKSEELMKNTSVLIATGDEEQAIKELEDTPGVKTVTIDRKNTFAREPNDEKGTVGWQYHLGTWSSDYGINARSAWDVTTGSSEINVAVIDTGKIEHPDLVGKWLPGWDFVQDDNNPTDPGLTPGDTDTSGWHGTLIAGVIAANTNNSIGVAGVNWNAKITPVRTGGGDGSYTSDMILGIRWAAGLPVAGTTLNPNPAEVINLSMGSDETCQSDVQAAINEAVATGALVVVAAGNESQFTAGVSPANCNNVVTVGATDQNGGLASFSNYGSQIDVVAPGVGIMTTSCYPQNTCTESNYYEAVDGTSFAAPIVAGVASLALSINPSLTPAQLETLLKASSNRVYGYYCDSYGCGTGIIDAYKVVDDLGTLWVVNKSIARVTMPFGDAYRDSFDLTFDSRSSSNATISILTENGSPTSFVDQVVSPSLNFSVYRGSITLSPSDLTAGNYQVRITQGANSIFNILKISSGELQSIVITRSSASVYPFVDGFRDTASVTVTGVDEMGGEVPVIGAIKIRNTLPVNLTTTNNIATWNWSQIPKGTHTLSVTGTGLTGASKTATSTIVVGASVATKTTVTTNSSTVYPVKDNYIDSSVITVSLTTNSGTGVPGSGTVWIYKGAKKIQGWNFTRANLNSSEKMVITWNGRAGGKIAKGSYSIRVSFKSSENGRTVTASKNIVVSDKKRVLKTKKGSWYTAVAAFDSCYGTGYRSCEYYQSTGVRYYSGTSYSDAVASESSLPFPVNRSSVHSWRVKVNGWSTDADYYLVPCVANNSAATCSGSDSGSMYFSGNAYVDRTWTSGYTKTGIADGYANWIILSTDWGSFYAYKYQIEVRYWALV